MRKPAEKPAPIDLASFITEVPEKKGTSYVIELPPAESHELDIYVRSQSGVVVNGVLATGETVYLDQGDNIRIADRVSGLVGIEIIALDKSPVSHRCMAAPIIEGEVLDPTPAAVAMEISEEDTLRTAVRNLLNEHLEKMGLKALLSTEEDPDALDELIDDVLASDHEFEDDMPNDFISQHEEMDEDYPADDFSLPPDRPEGPERPPEAEPSQEPSGDPS